MSGAVSLGAVALAIGTGFATSFSTFAIVGILGATLGAIGTIAKVKELQYAGMALGAVGAIGGIASSLNAFGSGLEAAAAVTPGSGAGPQLGLEAATPFTDATSFTTAGSAATGTGAAGTAGAAMNAADAAATGSAGVAQGAANAAAPGAVTAAAPVSEAAVGAGVNVAEWGGQGGYDAINMVNGFDPTSVTYAALDPSAAATSTTVAGTYQPDSLLNMQNAPPPPEVTTADFGNTAPSTTTEGTQIAGGGGTDTLSGGTGSDSLRGGVQVDEYGNVAQGDSNIAPKPATQTSTSTQPAAQTTTQTTTQTAPQGDIPGLDYKLGTNPKLDGSQPGTWDAGVRATAGKTPSLIGEADIPVERDMFDKIGDWAQKNQMLVYGGFSALSGVGKSLFASESGSGKQALTQEELDALRAQTARNYAAEAVDRENAEILAKRKRNMDEPAPRAVTGTPPWFGPEFRPPTGLINSLGSTVTGTV